MTLRRLVAALVDGAPFAIALGLASPILLALLGASWESWLGLGLFDPRIGADPVVVTTLDGLRPQAIGAALGLVVWLGLQAGALAMERQSIGCTIAGLSLEACDGLPPSAQRALLRGVLRRTCAALLVLLAALALPLARSGHLDWLGLATTALAATLALHLVLDALLAVVSGRSLADRLAGTQLVR